MDRKTQCSVAMLLALGATAATAQMVNPVRPQYEFPGATPPATGAGSMRMGETPFYFAPFASLAAGQDDNLFLSANDQRRSWLAVLGLGATFDARDPNKVFQFSYQANLGRYTSSREDDYHDHTIRASFDMLATREAAFRVGYDYLRGHDPRGSTDRPVGNSPDKFEAKTPSVMFAYGQKDARGRAELFYSDTEKRYKNNRTFTAGSDRDTKEAGAAVYVRVMPKTQVLAEYRRTDLDYVLTNGLSGQEERFYGGVTWEATAATSGTIKGGRLKKEFDGLIPDFSGTGWEALVTWAPRTYSKFDLFSYRQPVESTGEGSFILSDATGAAWSHEWSSVWTTEASFKFQKDKYQSNPRSDEITAFGLRANYKFRRWLTFGAQYQYTNRDSNVPINEYDRNFWLLSIAATM